MAHDALLTFSAGNFSNAVVAEIAMYAGLVFAGYGLASVASKQSLRLYHYRRYGVTNEEYIALRLDEIADLEKTWNVKPDLANDVFNYLKDEILHSKAEAKKVSCSEETHLHTAASTKLVLKKFRSAGGSDDGSLMVITDYFYKEVETSKKRIEDIGKQLECYQRTMAKPLSLVVEAPGDEKKEGKAETKENKEREDLQIKRNLLFLQRNAVRKKDMAAGAVDVAHTVVDELQAEIQEHQGRINVIRGFAARLTPSG